MYIYNIPDQGRILFARRCLARGEVVAVEQRESIIKRYFSGVEELRLYMAGVQVGRRLLIQDNCHQCCLC